MPAGTDQPRALRLGDLLKPFFFWCRGRRPGDDAPEAFEKTGVVQFGNLEAHAQQQPVEGVDLSAFERVLPLSVRHCLGDDLDHQRTKLTTPVLQRPRQHGNDARLLAHPPFRPRLTDTHLLGCERERRSGVSAGRQEVVEVLRETGDGSPLGEGQRHE
jgi:hypothetical protein